MRYVRVEFESKLRDARLDRLVEDRELSVTLLDAPALSGGAPIGSSLTLPLDAIRAPLAPGKIVCVGQNYRKHAAELGKPVPEEPLLFLKASSSVIGPGEPIRTPPESERVDHEGELGVVIGKRMVDVRAEDALAHVFGYVGANDVTARDLQRKDVQFTRAKSFDSFCPIGPFVETDLDPWERGHPRHGERRAAPRRAHGGHGLPGAGAAGVHLCGDDAASRRPGADGHARRRGPLGEW
jgi:2-keto-4-pentenoate hydratase/2-oxohepta-3-ene-1,7-dioic acid hydratase in catechol pathway